MYPHLCTVKTGTAGTAGGLGGNTPTYSAGTSTPCEFWFDKGGALTKIGISGQAIVSVPMVKIPPDLVTPALTNHVVTTQAGWAGTYEIDLIDPSPGLAGTVHHYECQIRKVAA